MNWNQTRLGDLVEVAAGQGAPQLADEFSDEGTPFVRAGSLEKLTNGGTLDGCERIPERTVRSRGLRLFPTDTILFAKSGQSATKDRVFRLPAPAYVVNHLAALVPTGRCDPGFLTYWLQRNPPSRLIRDDAYPSVRLSEIAELPIAAPPKSEQRRIAAILDKADAIRRKRRQALAETDTLLRSVFLDMFGADVEGAHAQPVVTLGALVDQHRGISYGIVQRGAEIAGGVPVIRISNILGNRFDPSDVVRTSPEISSQYKRTIIRGGELLLSIRGTVGLVAIAPKSARGWNVSREIAVIPLKSDADEMFIQQLMISPLSQRFLVGEVRGVAQRGINLSDVRRLPVPDISTYRLHKFSDLHRTSARLKGQYERVAELSASQFSSLSQRAFRGEL